MQSVPTLVGTGAAVAAAASGFVFGQPSEAIPSTTSRHRSHLHSRTLSVDRAFEAGYQPNLFFTSRPSTTTAAAPPITSQITGPATASSRAIGSRPPLSRYQRPQTSQITSPRSSVRRPPIPRHQLDLSPSVPPEPSRDTLPSNGSWIRRLSLRPLSQHGSVRSSLVVDSPSATYPPISATPIPSRSGPPLPPNKLVKRSSSAHRTTDEEHPPATRSRGLPTLRRPATSHQRSANLQQFRADVDIAGGPVIRPYCKYASEQSSIWPEELLGASPLERGSDAQSASAWKSYIHSRRRSIATSAGVQDRSADASPSTLTRIWPENNPPQRVHLLKPSMISASLAAGFSLPSRGVEKKESACHGADASKRLGPSPEIASDHPTKMKRSLSVTLSSAANSWVSRTSGSLRRPKLRTEQMNGGNKLHLPHAVSGSPSAAAHRLDNHVPGKSASATIEPNRQGSTRPSVASIQRPYHKRNMSSPLPPLTVSSLVTAFHDELSQLSRSGGAAISHTSRPNQPSGSSTSSAAMSHMRGSHFERSPILGSSDGDGRGFTSGDDDDTDFKSDTLFDSLRTLASGRVGVVETPLDSMYDESPPSTADNGRTKGLSIQEMLGGRGRDGGGNIPEEDENTTTPVHVNRRAGANFSPGEEDLANKPRFILEPSSHSHASKSVKDLGHLSLDDDFDEDWTRDDGAPAIPLSPLSKGSTRHSRGINPKVRLALASIEVDSAPSATAVAACNDRPPSNLFDWSEPSLPGDQGRGGNVPRPRTAFSKPEMDSRGGRSAMRRGQSFTHARSQSVPVVHDVIDESKPTGAKYGTWGLGTKTVAEDWDEDFEFGGNITTQDGTPVNDMFAVPESIRATQPSVKAHSGHIRELSLLVGDLRRLCCHGREMSMLDGEQRGLWKEAEGIIALASPDEDDTNEDHEDHESASSVHLDAADAIDSPLDDGHDAPSMNRLDAAIECQETAMSKTAVVRERQSPRRRSVVSPEDDIFGGSWPSADEGSQPNRLSRPRTPEGRASKPGEVTGVVRSKLGSKQHHDTPTGPLQQPRNNTNNNTVQFDTNSLKALVRRAGELRDILSDSIRRADQATQSPARTPRHERHQESSPAFTRVFDDPGSSPPRRSTIHSLANSLMDHESGDKSPRTPINRRVPLMTAAS
ncbi:hypothetical protein RJ55_00809 [Drechmeria coniospora]|nr:hypothetical protein RJ55_00809 [Drechmeria coniospora]